MKSNLNKLYYITLLLLMAVGCKEDIFIDDLAGLDPTNDLASYEVQLTGPGQTGGEIYLDLGTGTVYNYADAVEQPEKIDFVMLWGTSTGSNFVAPWDIDRLMAWGTGNKINDEWFVKNKTMFVRLESSEEGHQLYDDVKMMEDLKPAYEALKKLAENQDGYNTDHHGEGTALRGIEVGDVIGIKTEKDVYAITKVQGLVTGNAGNLRLSVKVDKRNEKDLPSLPESERMTQESFTVTELSTMGGTNLIDLSSGVQWEVSEGYYSQNNVDAVFYRDEDGVTLSSLSDNIPLLSEGASEISGDWTVRNETRFIRLKASPEATNLFTRTYTNTLIREAFKEGEAMVSDYDDYDKKIYGPGLSVSGLEVEDVVLYHVVDKDVYGMLMITEADDENTVVGRIKADVQNKTEVAPPLIQEFTSTGAGASKAMYVDLKTNSTFETEAEGKENIASVDIISLRGSSSGHNLFPTANEAAAGAWFAPWRDRMATWSNRNAADVYSLGATEEAWELYHNLQEDESMWDVFQEATANVSSTQRLSQIANKEIIFIHSVDRKLLIALKVLDSSTDTSVTYRYKIIEL